jgi:hypothetical protein
MRDSSRGSISRHHLEELLAKYTEMLSMRLAHNAGTDDAARSRSRMKALAARFPGALRQLDELELHEIRRRLEGLERVLESGAEPEQWMEVVALFHVLARGALEAKRWLAGRRVVDEAADTAHLSEDARLWAGHLHSVARPPGGHLTRLVLARVASSLGTSEARAREIVFGPPRRR